MERCRRVRNTDERAFEGEPRLSQRDDNGHVRRERLGLYHGHRSRLGERRAERARRHGGAAASTRHLDMRGHNLRLHCDALAMAVVVVASAVQAGNVWRHVVELGGGPAARVRAVCREGNGRKREGQHRHLVQPPVRRRDVALCLCRAHVRRDGGGVARRKDVRVDNGAGMAAGADARIVIGREVARAAAIVQAVQEGRRARIAIEGEALAAALAASDCARRPREVESREETRGMPLTRRYKLRSR